MAVIVRGKSCMVLCIGPTSGALGCSNDTSGHGSPIRRDRSSSNRSGDEQKADGHGRLVPVCRCCTRGTPAPTGSARLSPPSAPTSTSGGSSRPSPIPGAWSQWVEEYLAYDLGQDGDG